MKLTNMKTKLGKSHNNLSELDKAALPVTADGTVVTLPIGNLNAQPFNSIISLFILIT